MKFDLLDMYMPPISNSVETATSKNAYPLWKPLNKLNLVGKHHLHKNRHWLAILSRYITFSIPSKEDPNIPYELWSPYTVHSNSILIENIRYDQYNINDEPVTSAYI